MKYVLSCDGGGVRGVITTKFLLELERVIGPLYERFDMFAGTSIGGIIMGLVGVKGASMDEIRKIYDCGDIEKIFDKSCLDNTFGVCQLEPKYDGKGKRDVLEKYLGDLTFGSSGRNVLVTTYDVVRRGAKFYKSYRDSDKGVKCVDALDATSAAPAYFPSHQKLIDGGVVLNNPAMCAYIDAKKLWPNEEIRVLSIGTGCSDKEIKGTENWGGIQWIAGGLISVLMDQSHVDYQMNALLDDGYFRVNGRLNGLDDSLDNVSCEHIEKLEMVGDDLWQKYGAEVCEWLDKK